MVLSVQSYWSGSDQFDRRVTYFEEYNARKNLLESNAAETIRRIQLVVNIFEADTDIKLPGRFSSGWRPQSVNDPSKLSGAGLHSNHLDAAAGDVTDTNDGNFAWWCFHHQGLLQKCVVWQEHPSGTVLVAKDQKKNPWTHLQIFSPKSGLRVYQPNSSSAERWNAFLLSSEKAPGDLWA